MVEAYPGWGQGRIGSGPKKKKKKKVAAGNQEQTFPTEGCWPPESSLKEDAVVPSFCSFKARWARAPSTNHGERPRGETSV